MKEFFDYVKKDENGNDCGYDYDAIVSDVWKQLNYSGKLETVRYIMQFSHGRLNPVLVVESFNRIKERQD